MKALIVKNDFSKLNAFIKGFDDKHVVKVGVLKRKNSREDDPNATNADLGAIHEFGSKTQGIPARSWLRMPIRANSKKIIAAAGKGAKERLAAGDRVGLLKVVGINAEKNIIQAFETGGFGAWPDNAEATIAAKGSSAPLIDSGQLKRAVASEVVDA